MRVSMRSWWLGLALLLGCDRGIEANQDNLTHFAAVASDLRRDARELELLAAKVEGVQKRLEQRKSDIAEHVLSQEMAMRRDRLLARLRPATEPAAPSEPSEPSEGASAPALPDPKAIPGVLALHEELITPLDIADDSLRSDNDYWWWLEELGLQIKKVRPMMATIEERFAEVVRLERDVNELEMIDLERARRLREKLEADPRDPVYLRTEWGSGYRFTPSGRSS